MLDRLARYAPFTGILFVVLALAGIFSSHSSPGASASGARVIDFYTAHHSGQQASDILFTIGALFFLFFAASLYGFLRRSDAGTMPLLGLGGALLLALGFAVFSAIDFALADVPAKLTPSAAQALNVLDNDFIFPLVLGAWAFGIAIGLSIVRSDRLPAWLGWVLIAIGIVAGSPADFIGLFALFAWTLVVSVLIYRRTSPAVAERPLATAPA